MFDRMACHIALIMAVGLASVKADLADTYTMTKVLDWQRASEMQLSISASEVTIIPYTFTVIPLTTNLGLNESQLTRGQINIQGNMVAADESNYANISGDDVIPYLCCDQMNNSFIQPDMILNSLMSANPQPKAILLYSQQGMCCGLAGQNLAFNAILTMADATAASQARNITSSGGGTVRATVSGNFTSDDDPGPDGQQNGNNSAVAMSILYSITGLITLLFLVIIATGAIRAHRYPERYGPRTGFGGRPRQSRVKGLARAVLETIPIVKFGDSENPKPDPHIELENAADANNEGPSNGSSRHLSTIPESPTDPSAPLAATGALRTSPDAEAATAGASSSAAGGGTNSTNADEGNDEALGCSICTENFTVGEDVRVLPCNHKYHPQCVDPWLVNVSGTCPLCRLDLNPEQGDEDADENDEAPPPLGADSNEAGDSSNHSRRRSRLFDLHRLRHATVEERIEALRQYRAQQRQGSTSGSTGEDSHGRTKLTDRLRDRFRIRTRTAQQERSSSSAQTEHTNGS